MAYGRESYGERSTDRLSEESVGGEIEEEPNDLDQPEGLFDEDDDLEEGALAIEGEELDDEGESDEDDADRASPLAEDAPPKRARAKDGMRRGTAKELSEEEPGHEHAAALVDEEDDIDATPGVRTSGGSDVSVMNESDRRREFPRVSREGRGPSKRKEGSRSAGSRRGRRRKPARA
jgi:hypothetical protein